MKGSTRVYFFVFTALVLALVTAGPAQAVDFVRGDANDDGVVTIADAHRIISFLFVSGGEIACGDAFDFDNNGDIQMGADFSPHPIVLT